MTLAVALVVACAQAEEPESSPATSAAIVTTAAPPPTSNEPSTVSVTAEPTSLPPAPTTFPDCADISAVEAPAAWYREKPVYVGNEQPIEQVRAWASDRPGYQDFWVDRDHLGWITVAFSDDAETRQAELEAEFPDVGVVAVEVPTTLAELLALQQRAHQLLDAAGVKFAGSATYVDRWVVGLDLNVADERVATALAPVAGERICLNDMGVPTPEGPQPTAGNGWLLLGDELVGEAYRTGIATTAEQYAELWRQVGMAGLHPCRLRDPRRRVVRRRVRVELPIRLDDVAIDADPPLPSFMRSPSYREAPAPAPLTPTRTPTWWQSRGHACRPGRSPSNSDPTSRRSASRRNGHWSKPTCRRLVRSPPPTRSDLTKP